MIPVQNEQQEQKKQESRGLRIPAGIGNLGCERQRKSELLLLCNILNITPEKDLNAPPSPLPPFPPQPLPQLPPPPMTSAVRSSGNGRGRQQWWKSRQWRGHTTINQQMAATATKKAFVVVAVATAAALAAAVATASMAAMTAMAAVQMVAAVAAVREIN